MVNGRYSDHSLWASDSQGATKLRVYNYSVCMWMVIISDNIMFRGNEREREREKQRIRESERMMWICSQVVLFSDNHHPPTNTH